MVCLEGGGVSTGTPNLGSLISVDDVFFSSGFSFIGASSSTGIPNSGILRWNSGNCCLGLSSTCISICSVNFLGFGASTGLWTFDTLAGGAPPCGFHGAVFTPGARAGSNLSRASLTGFCSSSSISASGRPVTEINK